jgi:hypothetical protein
MFKHFLLKVAAGTAGSALCTVDCQKFKLREYLVAYKHNVSISRVWICHIQWNYYHMPSCSHIIKFAGTWLNTVAMLQLLTMMLNCPLILPNQMRWKTCFSRILILKVRHADVLLISAKWRDNKQALEFHIGGMKICFWWIWFDCSNYLVDKLVLSPNGKDAGGNFLKMGCWGEFVNLRKEMMGMEEV